VFVATIWFACFVAVSAQSAGTGTITGHVTDGVTGRSLAGVTVAIDGLTLRTVTDRNGDFRLTSVPEGPRTVVTNYIGRKESRTPVEVTAGRTVTSALKLEVEGTFSELVFVTDLMRDAQERALNQQKTAPNITNVVSADQIGHFPDPNAAEVTQRIPGISIQRDQGEGRYVIVRGMEPRLNSMLINGERIPAPEADVRQVALDVIPADLLQAVEVSKALTPDMDGDAIGGAVNLITKRAFDRLSVFGTIGGGYNTSLDSYGQRNASFTIGRRFMANRVGFVLGTSATATKRGNQDFEPVYAAGLLSDLDLRNYTVNRRRNGLTTSVDIRPTAMSQYTIGGIYNHFIDDHEERQRLRNRLGTTRRLERELRDRTHIEHIWNLSFAGKHDLGNTMFEYHLQGAKSDQDDPGTIATTFRQSNVNFLPNVTPDSIDPNNIQANPQNESLAAYTFNQQVIAINANRDRDIVGAVDVRHLLRTTPGLTTFIKMGVKFRDKDKARTRDEVTLTVPGGGTPIVLSAAAQADGVTHSILDGRYTFGPFLDMAASRNLQNTNTLASAINHARDSEDATTGEQVAAGYVMSELFIGPKLYVLPGVRVEHFSADYVGNDVQFSPTGVWLSTTPISGSTNYTNVLPAAHVRYAATEDMNLRVAVTRTLARPNYVSLIPSRTFDDQNNRITIGNASLRPTLAWNADVMVERYLKSVGVLSAGIFYKKLHDYIYTFTSTDTINGELFTITQPLNGEAASIRGAEFTAQSQLRFLPAQFSGIGVYVNYTFTDSTAVFPGRTGEQSTLPGQSRHVGNVALSYERAGFSGRVAMNFHGSYVDVVGGSTGLDRFYDTHKQMDISFSQKITRNIRGYFNALNLSDAPLRYFEGVANRPLQEEHYRWWADFGVKINWDGR
jgi:TonB-dependent receptor